MNLIIVRSSHWRVLLKKGFLKNSQNSQENTCARDFFLKSCKLEACNFINKKTQAQVFSCEFCEISKKTFFTEKPRKFASVWWITFKISDTYA